MIDILSRLSKVTEHTVARLNVQSAINSALWLAGVTGMFGLAGVVFTDPPIQYFMVVFMSIGSLSAATGFVYFMITDPDKLRSENYELRKTALGIIEEKGSSIPVAVASVEAIADLSDTRTTNKPEGSGK